MTDVTVIGGSPRYSTVPLVSVTSDNVTEFSHPFLGMGPVPLELGKIALF